MAIGVAFIGVGNISGIYLKNITTRFTEMKIVGLCDLVREKAEKAAAEYGIGKIYTDMYEAFDDPAVDLILNITRPFQHYEVTKQALLHGKHVYSEKPLGASIEEGRELVALAAERKLMVGGAPDTFLGAGIQTCKKLIDDGFIGRPVGASGFMMSHGPESWHPDPEFFYKYGGGPMMDMGPYYITAMTYLLGRVETVSATTSRSFQQRTMTCKEHYGEKIDVDVSTFLSGTMRFESGAVGTLTTTFDVWRSTLPCIEIYGEKGTLFVPDPNTFDGPVKLYRPEDGEVREMPLLFGNRENSRGLGLLEMARAIRDGHDDFITSSRRTFHTLDVLTAFDRSSLAGRAIEMEKR
ncbi:MAG: Gfo/Idh/MocA family oxidoreductase [Clostridiales bacterium]|nr:Gfo/Idh/MocA family oxidoreductase [Clostridiales bacterium]MDD7368365.1 Gfo/Idh/MocA family oxidoreductase [Clostridiales bacterium]MDY2872949.1 Gfo/Idh/MocA family oxidoreductase [Eubacteriales bacterium]